MNIKTGSHAPAYRTQASNCSSGKKGAAQGSSALQFGQDAFEASRGHFLTGLIPAYGAFHNLRQAEKAQSTGQMVAGTLGAFTNLCGTGAIIVSVVTGSTELVPGICGLMTASAFSSAFAGKSI